MPVHDDVRQFEYLMMEVMQCGLSWDLMMKKREIFRSCFDVFNFNKIAAYGESDIKRILETPGMIRSRRKVEAVIHNARRFIELRREHGTFSDWLWAFSGGKTTNGTRRRTSSATRSVRSARQRCSCRATEMNRGTVAVFRHK